MIEQFDTKAFEAKLLRTVISDSKSRDTFLLTLKAKDLVYPFHQTLYTAISELSDEGIDPEVEMLNTKLNQDYDREALALLMDTNTPAPNNTGKLIDYVVSFNAKFNFLMGMEKIQKDIHKHSAHDFITEISKLSEETLNSMPTLGATSSNMSIEELMAMQYERIEPTATSIAAFNQCTNLGLAMPYLYLFNGERGSGKTAAGIQILKDISHIYKTLFISLEMGARLVQDRFKKIGEPKNMTLNFEATELSKIEHSIRLAVNNGVKVVLIDSIIAISSKEITGNRMEELSFIAQRLHKLAQDLDIAILLIVQSSKAEQNYEGKIPKLTTKGSGDVDYFADIIVQIVKKSDSSDEREFRCTKNRANGYMGKADSMFNTRSVKFPAADGYFNSSPEMIEYQMDEELEF